MHAEKTDKGTITLELTEEEFALVCAAFNNIEEKVEPSEYTTLMGATAEQIDTVRRAIFAARKRLFGS